MKFHIFIHFLLSHFTELLAGSVCIYLYLLYIYVWVCDSEVIVFFRSFKKAFNDVILSRRAIRNMNTLYPDATPEELAAADNVCIICREEMVTGKQSTCNCCIRFIVLLRAVRTFWGCRCFLAQKILMHCIYIINRMSVQVMVV